jgi:hypothetical protein
MDVAIAGPRRRIRLSSINETTRDPRETQVGGGHYKSFAIQPTEYIVKNRLDWCEGNIVKYISRHRGKGGAEDVRKAIHYAQLLLKLEYGEDYV